MLIPQAENQPRVYQLFQPPTHLWTLTSAPISRMQSMFYACVLLAVPCAHSFILDTFFGGPPKTVAALDLTKYTGRWFQMYASQSVVTLWESGAVCVTADYIATSTGRVTVLNSERLGSANGTLKVIHGYAEPEGTGPGKFKVHLEGVPVGADYWVLKLGPATYGDQGQYEYAIVSDHIRGTLFVLARDPVAFKATYDKEVTSFLDANGFTSFYNNRVVTYHGQDCIYNTDHQ